MDENISPFNTKNKIITVDDIKLFYKDRFIDFTRLPNNRYDNITNINLTGNIKYIGKIDSNDIWLETNNNIYLCGIPFSPTRSWYKIKDISDIDTFQNYFSKNKENISNISNLSNTNINTFKFAVELNNMNFNDFISFIYLHQFTEKHICDNFKDLNKSIRNNLIIYDDQIRILNNFTKSNNNSFFIKTKFSKSIIHCELFDNFILINIFYDEIKLKNRYEKLPNFCPSDIGIIFNSFKTLFYSDIINIFNDSNDSNNLNNSNNSNNLNSLDFNIVKYYLNILFLIADKNKLKIDLSNLNFNDEIINFINDKFDLLDCDILFSKIEKEGIFKAFENSFDILLQTFFEKINNDDKIQLNSLYLTEKLKNKIDEIFKNKLI